MILRSAHLSDLPSVYEICHLTGYSGQDASSVMSDRSLLGQYYAAPYVVRDPQWCWMAADDQGVAGYLVTTPDSRAFASWMNAEWLPAVRALFPQKDGKWSTTEAWLRKTIHEPAPFPDFADEYPAHLHIDFLPRAQRQGLGTAALKLFLEQLRSRGVRGFHLGVGAKNTAAQGFYAKQGFEVIRRDSGVVFFGLKV